MKYYQGAAIPFELQLDDSTANPNWTESDELADNEPVYAKLYTDPANPVRFIWKPQWEQKGADVVVPDGYYPMRILSDSDGTTLYGVLGGVLQGEETRDMQGTLYIEVVAYNMQELCDQDGIGIPDDDYLCTKIDRQNTGVEICPVLVEP